MASKIKGLESKVGVQGKKVNALVDRIAKIRGRLGRTYGRYLKAIEACVAEDKGWKKSPGAKKQMVAGDDLEKLVRNALSAVEDDPAPAAKGGKAGKSEEAEAATPRRVKVKKSPK